MGGTAARYPFQHPNDDFVQPGNLYRHVMADEARDHLIGNIVSLLRDAQKRIQLRQTALFWKADPEYGRRVAEGLGLESGEVDRLATLSREDREKASAQ